MILTGNYSVHHFELKFGERTSESLKNYRVLSFSRVTGYLKHIVFFMLQ